MKFNKFFVIFVVILAVAGAGLFFRRAGFFSPPVKESSSPPQTANSQMKPEVVKLKTKDDVEIIGDFYDAPTSEIGVLMLHMMPATRKSFSRLAEKFQEKNMKVLAIDLRGHGESAGGPAGYQLFSEEEHKKSSLDVESAAAFLKEQGAKTLYLIGASIGANLSLRYLAEDPDVKAAVLLSPGINYHGVRTDDVIKKVYHTKAIYFAAANDDTYSYDTVQRIFEMTPEGVKKELKLFETGGHGTALFDSHPELADEILEWLQNLSS